MMSKVAIDICRYEHLLDIESRVDVLVYMLSSNRYLSVEDILNIVGTCDAIMLAEKMKKEENAKKYGYPE